MPKQKNTKNVSPKNKSVRSTAPVSVGYQPPEPSFRSIVPKDGCAAYRGVDYVTALNSATSIVVGGYRSLMPSFLPRLAQISSVFRRYKYRKMIWHLIGRSASTQKGVVGFASIVDDTASPDLHVLTESDVKNIQGCLVLKGWESGRHVVDVAAQGVKWYTTDVDDGLAVSPGYTYIYTPATTANGDLSWDLYVEYEVEFDIAVTADIISAREARKKEDTSAQIERLEEQIRLLKTGSTGT